MTRRSYSGNAITTTLNGAITNTATSLVVVDASGYPTAVSGPFVITVDLGLTTEEKILVGARTLTTMSSLTRGYDGTTAVAHSTGASVKHTISAVDVDEANAHINSTVNVHGIADTSALLGRQPGGTSAVAAKIPYFNAKDYGALGNGIADDTTAVQSAINAAASAGGAVVMLPYGTYKISSTLAVTTPNVMLNGSGGDSNHDVGALSGATTLKWAGSSGGTMLSFASPTGASAQTCTGGGVVGISFDSSGTAGTGLSITSWRDGLFSNLFFFEMSVTGLLLTCSSGGGEARDSQRNTFSNISCRIFSAGGSFITLDGIATANSSFNTFENCAGSFVGSTTTGAYNLRNCDNNLFLRCVAYCPTTGTSLICHAGATGFSANSNLFLHFSANTAIKLNGTEEAVEPSSGNTFYWLDNGNGTPTPTLGTGARATWSFNNGLHEKEMFSNLVAGDGIAETTVARDSLTGSLRIVNGSQNHMQLATTDLANRWGIAALANGDLRFAQFAGTGKISTNGADFQSGRAGFNNAAPINKPTVTGSRGGNAALASLLTALANYGLIADSTTI